jgi:hypothetical protein
MKKFKPLIITLVAFVGLVFIINQLYKKVPNIYDARFAAWQKQKDSTQVLFVGNSHIGALQSYPVGNMSSYNMAYAGMEWQDAYTIINQCLQQNTSLKYIVLGCNYDQIGHATSNSLIGNMLLPYTAQQAEGTEKYFSFLKPLHFLKHDRTLKPLVNYYKNGITVKDDNTIITLDFKDKSDKQGCIKRAQELGKISYSKNRIAANKELLIKINNLAKSKNITLVLLSTPKGDCFMQEYNKYISNAEQQLVKELANNLQIKFVDFYNNPAFNEDDILDFDHLNSKGAQKLNGLLLNSMLN